ncbi:hypothetical protein IC757_11760 [Wenzhouxiangella sp. AB-CW3]|uniref:hypothetical protein n=1 Tax=Wenzhouxiangella sp. AB-CW3 TaxID=2771012 RepID=UPI00168BE827|nr:hypothetical protein [Wenzhouxiangella sp. AB-CW3]QOC21713.1 hypothetical protein IC757_11760 [Wenzhouxiangella sp. AB-CW3]
MRRSLLDMQVAAGAVVVSVAGFSLGGVFAWGGLALAAGGATLYGMRFRPAPGHDADNGRSTANAGVADVLWADAERALRILDRYPDEGELAEPVIRLARLARRAVERGRRSPADPAAARTRHVLCLAAETLAAFDDSEPGRRQRRLQRMREVLDEAAETLARDAGLDAEDQALCVRLRVLEQELKNMPIEGGSDGNDHHD